MEAPPYLVSFDGSNLLIGGNGVADLLYPCLERTFRDGLGHLGYLYRLGCRLLVIWRLSDRAGRNVPCNSLGE